MKLKRIVSRNVHSLLYDVEVCFMQVPNIQGAFIRLEYLFPVNSGLKRI